MCTNMRAKPIERITTKVAQKWRDNEEAMFKGIVAKGMGPKHTIIVEELVEVVEHKVTS